MEGVKWSFYRSKGFTTLEVIIVIIIMAILTVTIGYKFFPRTEVSSATAVEQILADIQYCQVLAMGTLSQKSITFTTNSNVYNMAGEQRCLPGDAKVLSTTLPGGVLTFNTMGEPIFGLSNKTISLSGGKTITVRAITGKVEGQ